MRRLILSETSLTQNVSGFVCSIQCFLLKCDKGIFLCVCACKQFGDEQKINYTTAWQKQNKTKHSKAKKTHKQQPSQSQATESPLVVRCRLQNEQIATESRKSCEKAAQLKNTNEKKNNLQVNPISKQNYQTPKQNQSLAFQKKRRKKHQAEDKNTHTLTASSFFS